MDTDLTREIRSDHAGRLAVTVESRPLDDLREAADYLVLLESSNGAIVWSHAYEEHSQLSADFDPGGDVFVKHGDQSVQRLAPQFGGAKHEYVDAVAVDGLGDVVVIVQMDEEDSDAENSARARKVSGVDGALMWETALGDGSAEARSAPAVDLMPNGDAVVAWWLKRALPSQAHVTRLSGVDGGVVWTVPIDVGTSEIRVVTSLAVDAVGDIALIVGSASNAALLKLSGESGSQLRSSDASAGAVSFDPTGNVIVASSHVSRFSGAEGTFLGAVSSAFGEPTNMALAVSATGDIVLAGSTWANVTATDRHLDLDGFVMKVLQ